MEESDIFTAELWTKIEGSLQNCIRNAIPGIIENVIMELQCSFNAVVNQKINEAKEEIYAKVQNDTDFIDLKNDVAAKCEAEKLETYNRRENVKIVGLREDADENGQIVREDMEDTMLKKNELAKSLDNRYDVKDLSIAHRLPTRRGNVEPV